MNAKSAQKVQMPLGIRKKMMASVSMLLVAAIMMVSSSYAWFTLSTAPEITGISTSVGANGNLEIALLTTDTFKQPGLITSNTGDSMSATNQTVTGANITWGNLINLDDPSYGLEKIKLYPAALNLNTEGTALQDAPLSTPVYGADGRVEKVEANTLTAIYNSVTASFALPAEGDVDYGVRAVGTSSDVSARTIAFRSAKATYNASMTSAVNNTRNAINTNSGSMVSLALKMQNNETNATRDQVVAMQSIAIGVQRSLQNVVKAYANAIVAKAAADTTNVTDAIFSAVSSSGIASETDAAELKKAISVADTFGGLETYSQVLDKLAAQQETVDKVVEWVAGQLKNSPDATTFTLDDIKTNLATPLLGEGTTGIKAYKTGEDSDVETNLSSSELANIKSIHIVSGTINDVAAYTGTFMVGTFGVEGIAKADLHAGVKGNDDGSMANITATVAGLTAPTGSKDPNMTDYYGYIIDFAFRTNAANSKLQLQTDAINRVYKDDTSPASATQGGGSKATFTYGDGVTKEMAINLLKAVRVVFFNAETKGILAVGAFADVMTGETAATANLTLHNMETTTTEAKWVLGQDAYTVDSTSYTIKDSYKDVEGASATLDATAWNQLSETTTTADGSTTLGKDAYEEVKTYKLKADFTVQWSSAEGAMESVAPNATNCSNYSDEAIDQAAYDALLRDTKMSIPKTTVTVKPSGEIELADLTQNQVLKVSALVYMDGNNIDNSSVGAAMDSGELSLNLQFSSSATLHPMENNALKNMQTTTDNTQQGGGNTEGTGGGTGTGGESGGTGDNTGNEQGGEVTP